MSSPSRDDLSGAAEATETPGRRSLTAVDRGTLGVFSARCLFIAVAVGLVARSGSRVDGYSVATIVLVGLAADVRAPFTLRNFALLYTIGLFYVGTRLIYPDRQTLSGDLLLYVAAFVVGYGLVKSSWEKGRLVAAGGHRRDRAFDPRRPVIPALETILRVLGAVEVARWLLLVAPFGIRGFYRGQELASRITSYGQTGTTTQAIANIVLTSAIAATVAVYCAACFQAGRPIRYRLLSVVLIFVPALSLQRSVLVLHSMLLAGVYICDKHFRTTPATTPAATDGRRTRLRRWLPAGLVILAAIGLAVKIGDIRTRQLDQTVLSNQATGSSLQQVLRGEFTPIEFYRDVKGNMGSLHYRYGEPIVAAFVTRGVPRSVWPNKPVTSQEIYMRARQPVQLAQGFSLAPSLFGVLYLNFGWLGTALGVALLGGIAAYYDRALAGGLVARVPQFLIVLTWFYSLLRDDLATSAFSIVLTLVAYRCLRAFFQETRPGDRRWLALAAAR